MPASGGAYALGSDHLAYFFGLTLQDILFGMVATATVVSTSRKSFEDLLRPVTFLLPIHNL